MTYPGNPSLPPDVQQRIRSTFDHTLGLAEAGSHQEALLGCDFVLRMDPLFEPARRLQERLDASSGPVAVEDLRRFKADGLAPAGPAQGRGGASPAGGGAGMAGGTTGTGFASGDETLWADLDGLSTELPELPEPHWDASPGEAPLALRAELEALLGERRFQELLDRANQVPSKVAGDLELQHLVSLAHQRLEAGPYVNRFLASARDALRAGNAAEGGRLIEKARSLDPSHPGIAVMERPTAAAADVVPPRASPNSPTWIMPTIPGEVPAVHPSEKRTQRIASPPWPPGGMPAGAANSTDSAGFSGFDDAHAADGGVDPDLGAFDLDDIGATTHAQPPAASQAGTTFSGGSGDSESERRIQQLLDEGQKALNGGDPQAAIDAWSRIFLIDIDHQEAARRIETARRLKAERDRQAEETFHDGLRHLEANDLGAAAEAFHQVLELQPGNLQAREYVQQLDQGQAPALPTGTGAMGRPAGVGTASLHPMSSAPSLGAASRAAGTNQQGTRAVGPPSSAMLSDDLMLAAGAAAAGSDHDLKEEILVPPDLSQAEARAAEPRREVRSASSAGNEGRARRLFVLVGSAVLLLVLAVGWFLYQKREQWFPNSRTEEPAQPAAPNPLPRAVKLHAAGKTAIALNQLRRVPPNDPHFKEAQALIARWQQEQDQAAVGAGALAAGAAGTTAPGAAGAAAGPGGAPGTPGAPGAAPSGPPGAPGSLGAAGGNGAAVAGSAAGPLGSPNVAGAATTTATTATTAGTGAQRWQSLVDEGRKAYRNGTYLLASERFEAADRLTRLTGSDSTQLADARQRLAPIQKQIGMVRSHDWQYALPALWKAHETDPASKDIVRLIVDCYYDLAVRDLQHDDPGHAAQKFTEAKTLVPDDASVQRQLLFAQTYQTRSPDLLYRIYVKYLPLR